MPFHFPLFSRLGKERGKVLKAFFGLVAVILICVICFPQFDNILSGQNPSQFDVYCAVYPYSYNNMTSLNQTDFEIQLDKVKEIGFTGIKLWNVECFYDENLLEWVMNETKERGLNVIIPIQYFNRSYSFPFPEQAWERKGFMENSAELNLFNEYVSNVSLIVRGYINFKGWIVYYPFNSTGDFWYWHERVAWTEYKWKLQNIIDAVRKASGHPVYLGVELWKEYPQDVWDRLPKDLNFIQGFAFQPYNTIKDNIQADKIREFYNYWKRFGRVQIAEFGYATHSDVYVHGLASSENRKADMIIEFLNYVKNLGHDGFVCYFGLTDFPPENADFGLVYGNYTLKHSGSTLKEWLKQNET